MIKIRFFERTLTTWLGKKDDQEGILMTQIISIVGKSDSGKTTLIEKLIPEIKKRGYRVGIVKNTAHGFDIDKKGKDFKSNCTFILSSISGPIICFFKFFANLQVFL